MDGLGFSNSSAGKGLAGGGALSPSAAAVPLVPVLEELLEPEEEEEKGE